MSGKNYKHGTPYGASPAHDQSPQYYGETAKPTPEALAEAAALMLEHSTIGQEATIDLVLPEPGVPVAAAPPPVADLGIEQGAWDEDDKTIDGESMFDLHAPPMPPIVESASSGVDQALNALFAAAEPSAWDDAPTAAGAPPPPPPPRPVAQRVQQERSTVVAGPAKTADEPLHGAPTRPVPQAPSVTGQFQMPPEMMQRHHAPTAVPGPRNVAPVAHSLYLPKGAQPAAQAPAPMVQAPSARAPIHQATYGTVPQVQLQVPQAPQVVAQAPQVIPQIPQAIPQAVAPAAPQAIPQAPQAVRPAPQPPKPVSPQEHIRQLLAEEQEATVDLDVDLASLGVEGLDAELAAALDALPKLGATPKKAPPPAAHVGADLQDFLQPPTAAPKYEPLGTARDPAPLGNEERERLAQLAERIEQAGSKKGDDFTLDIALESLPPLAAESPANHVPPASLPSRVSADVVALPGSNRSLAASTPAAPEERPAASGLHAPLDDFEAPAGIADLIDEELAGTGKSIPISMATAAPAPLKSEMPHMPPFPQAPTAGDEDDEPVPQRRDMHTLLDELAADDLEDDYEYEDEEEGAVPLVVRSSLYDPNQYRIFQAEDDDSTLFSGNADAEDSASEDEVSWPAPQMAPKKQSSSMLVALMVIAMLAAMTYAALEVYAVPGAMPQITDLIP